MKFLRILVALGLLTTMPFNANAKFISIFGLGTASCGSWADAAKDSSARVAYQSWVSGFVSAYNWYHQEEDVEVPDTTALVAWIDSYCGVHPLEFISAAAGRLVDALRQQRGLRPIMSPRSN